MHYQVLGAEAGTMFSLELEPELFRILITIRKINERPFIIKKLHVNVSKLLSKCNGRGVHAKLLACT